jgi:DNA-binding NarL/FixJ family response regulator
MTWPLPVRTTHRDAPHTTAPPAAAERAVPPASNDVAPGPGADPAVWVQAPHAVVRQALAAYVVSLGLRVVDDPAAADIALVELGTGDDPPAAPHGLPSIALVARPRPLPPAQLAKLGYRTALPHDASQACLLSALSDALEGVPGTTRPAPATHALTPREHEVLVLVSRGLPNKRIATTLGVSERTVKHFVSRLLHKLGAKGRWHLIAKYGDLAPRKEHAPDAPPTENTGP